MKNIDQLTRFRKWLSTSREITEGGKYFADAKVVKELNDDIEHGDNFIGSMSEWNQLSTAEKVKYKTADIFIQKYTLTIIVDNGVDDVILFPVATNNKYNEGTVVTIIATAKNGYTIKSGTGTVTMDEDKTINIVSELVFLKFSSDDNFTLSVNSSGWDGTLEYSMDDGDTWSTWDGSQLSGDANTPIYLRGSNNTKITGSTYMTYKWTFTGKYCTGNIETLLDYQTVLNGQHPTMASNCYSLMFRDCTSLVTAPELPATTLTSSCYNTMFYNCTSLVTVPELPAITLANSCYSSMFYGCTSLMVAPELPATKLAGYCYYFMFCGCTLLTAAPELSATKLADYCYSNMFQDCASLTVPPELPAITLVYSCYRDMFLGCTSLTAAPKLPATTLDQLCYFEMFRGCTSLTAAPELPATSLVQSCYSNMFYGCTSLTVVPELPATILADYCYSGMFQDCTSLTAAMKLPVTALYYWGCYRFMFRGCTSLVTISELPATTLDDSCYWSMFYGCTSLKISTTKTGEYQYPYRIPTSGTGTDANNALLDMFTETGGTFTGTPTINTTYYTDHQPIG